MADSSRVAWKDPRFEPAIDAVRSACGVPENNYEDDPMIGMLLDRYAWDHKKVVELYQASVERRNTLGMGKVREDIVSNGLSLDQLPHAKSIKQLVTVNGSSGIEHAASASPGAGDVEIDGKKIKYGNVIGCYEMRYGHGKVIDEGGESGAAGDHPAVSPQDFTQYMVYVTQWRWLQCEQYIRRHGELGFWSMIHDISCPQG